MPSGIQSMSLPANPTCMDKIQTLPSGNTDYSITFTARLFSQPLVRRASPKEFGGGERDRTDDLLLAKQALSQLSYTPISGCCPIGSAVHGKLITISIMVGLRRVELLTSPLSGVRSNQLSYRPVVFEVWKGCADSAMVFFFC